jgi:predicted RNA-binding Zn ribbon-like protein
MMVMQQAGGGHVPAAGAAPGQLELVRRFVNTLDIETRADELATAAALDGWLLGNGLAGEPGSPIRSTSEDQAEAVAMREALRSVLRGHVGSRRAMPGQDGVIELRDIAARLPVRLTIEADGRPAFLPAGEGPAASLTRILLIAAEAATGGTWTRLKVCSADDCQWAFYDRSPTRSGCWCSMAVCGSRAKSRSYRRRAAERR